MEERIEVVNGNIEPVESPSTEVHELVRNMGQKDYVLAMERAADNAVRIENAMRKLLIAVTQPGDWTEFDGKACLGHAGAQRYLKHFDMSLVGWTNRKETFSDDKGSGYRYIYECDAIWEGRQIHSIGIYGTREAFLGKVSGEYRNPSDINENHIQKAAYSICFGNAVKAMLGLKGLEWGELTSILQGQGKDTSTAGKVTHGKGAQGGISEADREIQGKIGTMLTEQYAGDTEAMRAAFIEATKFVGNDGKEKSCDSIKKCKGKWLRTAYGKIKDAHDEWLKLNGEEPQTVPMRGGDGHDDGLPY